jgi:hypothetical protein
MPGRVTLKAINDELSRRGITAGLSKGDGYFFFRGGEATEWLDKTVRVPTLGSLTIAQWVDEFRRLKKLNQEIMKGGAVKAQRKPRAQS